MSAVDETYNEHWLRECMIVEDPVRLDEIPFGTVCLARPSNALEFIRCEVVRRVSLREYGVIFDDGHEEKVDISCIARKVAGHLLSWEGVRVCAFYNPKLPTDPFKKAFYPGIVGLGPHGVAVNQMLIFFDDGFDAFTPERFVCLLVEQKYKLRNGKEIFFDDGFDAFTPERFVCLLVEQKYKLRNGKEVIDRNNNWRLLPPERQQFFRTYLECFPDWPLVPMKRKENTQRVDVLRDNKLHSALVLRTDKQFALLRFPDPYTPGADCVTESCTHHYHVDEWVYRGSERLD
ncbi:unnamed protein product, partial [Gongylonema pulchrum]|uniref:RNA_ligase domain-containing protein n=1 Tax=Gongylonema pulchrum TaxID=637853 RepID=A0A183EE52_9BILA